MYCLRFAISCQGRSIEYVGCGNTSSRPDDQVTPWRDLNRGDPFTNAFNEGISASDEKRNVSTELLTDCGKFITVEPQFPETIETYKGRSGVRTSAAHPGAGRDALLNVNGGARELPATAFSMVYGSSQKCLGRTYAEVFFWGANDVARAFKLAVKSFNQINRVKKVDQNEDGFQKMFAVGALTNDMQEKIELCGCRQVEAAACGGGCHASTKIVSCTNGAAAV